MSASSDDEETIRQFGKVFSALKGLCQHETVRREYLTEDPDLVLKRQIVRLFSDFRARTPDRRTGPDLTPPNTIQKLVIGSEVRLHGQMNVEHQIDGQALSQVEVSNDDRAQDRRRNGGSSLMLSIEAGPDEDANRGMTDVPSMTLLMVDSDDSNYVGDSRELSTPRVVETDAGAAKSGHIQTGMSDETADVADDDSDADYLANDSECPSARVGVDNIGAISTAEEETDNDADDDDDGSTEDDAEVAANADRLSRDAANVVPFNNINDGDDTDDAANPDDLHDNAESATETTPQGDGMTTVDDDVNSTRAVHSNQSAPGPPRPNIRTNLQNTQNAMLTEAVSYPVLYPTLPELSAMSDSSESAQHSSADSSVNTPPPDEDQDQIAQNQTLADDSSDSPPSTPREGPGPGHSQDLKKAASNMPLAEPDMIAFPSDAPYTPRHQPIARQGSGISPELSRNKRSRDADEVDDSPSSKRSRYDPWRVFLKLDSLVLPEPVAAFIMQHGDDISAFLNDRQTLKLDLDAPGGNMGDLFVALHGYERNLHRRKSMDSRRHMLVDLWHFDMVSEIRPDAGSRLGPLMLDEINVFLQHVIAAGIVDPHLVKTDLERAYQRGRRLDFIWKSFGPEAVFYLADQLSNNFLGSLFTWSGTSFDNAVKHLHTLQPSQAIPSSLVRSLAVKIRDAMISSFRNERIRVMAQQI